MAQNEASLLIRIKQVGGEVLTKLGSAMEGIAESAKYVGAALIGIGAAAINSFRESEAASQKLTQSMVNQGVYTKELAETYKKLSESIQKNTQFSDDQTMSAIATLQSFVGQRRVTDELTMAVANLAAVKKMDLNSAAELVGKTIGTETNALARQGVELQLSADKSERLAQVTEALNAKFGGQAEAAANGLGKMEQLKNVMDDVLENIGKKLAPFIGFFTQQLMKFSSGLAESTDMLNGFESVMMFISKAVLYAKAGILGLTEAISIGLAGAVESISLGLNGQFTAAKDAAKSTVDEIAANTVERNRILNEELLALDESKKQYEAAKAAEELLALQTSESNKTAVIQKELDARKAAEDKKRKEDFKKMQEQLQVEGAWQKAKADIVSASANLITELTGQGSRAAFLAQKAAALAQAYVATNLAATQALAVPPAPNFALAGMAKSAGYINIAAIAASTVKGLADGGIVKARPGGMPAIIGEGGQDEAVIPLDKAGDLGFGGGMTINFNGPIMGNDEQAREFAMTLDRELLKLRRSNQSVAFDTDVV